MISSDGLSYKPWLDLVLGLLKKLGSELGLSSDPPLRNTKCPKNWSTCFKMLQGMLDLINVLKQRCKEISHTGDRQKCLKHSEEIWPKVFGIVYSPHAAAPAVCHLLEQTEGNCHIFQFE